ncbi:ferritin-like domain-containing protein [Kitasatospora acidiphila]|uniref:ferritin-like domain-containing protein n=1 Tax=Kitasatospora acidiphila TaxID=2567942 RepID=UPI0015F040B6|nr:ferritin-like domain-containing protein [Kitasatospora acidiphila]
MPEAVPVPEVAPVDTRRLGFGVGLRSPHLRHIRTHWPEVDFFEALTENFLKITWNKAGANRQYQRGYWNQNGGGKTVVVTDLKSALKALNEIIDQGEGSPKSGGTVPRNPISPRDGLEEYSHYVKFERIYNRVEGIGIGDGEPEKEVDIDSPLAVAMLAKNPKVADYARKDQNKPWPTEPLWDLMTLFNAAFTYTMHLLDTLYAHPTDDMQDNGHSARYHLERLFVAAMQGILYPVADLLTRTPTGRRHTVHGQKWDEYAGPSFEYHPFGTGPYAAMNREAELAALCTRDARHFPELGGDDGVQRQISLLTPVMPT